MRREWRGASHHGWALGITEDALLTSTHLRWLYRAVLSDKEGGVGVNRLQGPPSPHPPHTLPHHCHKAVLAAGSAQV